MNKDIEMEENIPSLKKANYIYIKNHMEPHKSYIYGHTPKLEFRVRNIKEGKCDLVVEREVLEVPLVRIEEELENLERKHELKGLFQKQEKTYEGIHRMAAATINPYRSLPILARKEKMKKMFMESGNFQTLEDADLFLYEYRRVSKHMLSERFGRIELNYFATRDDTYFLIDKDSERIFFTKDQEEMETYLLIKLSVLPEKE